MADLVISVDLDATGVKRGVDSVRSYIGGLDFKGIAEKAKVAGTMIRDFGSGMMSVGTQLAIGVTAPLLLAGRAILSAGGEYEKALNIFQATTKATTVEMSMAAQRAKELGADLSLPATSAKDAALAMTELGKAGLTASQAMDAAKGVLQLAAAGQIEEARAAEIAANALNAFKLEASETTRVANLLAAASNASSSEVNDIALSMQQASSSFSAAKIPIEDMVTAISALANAGIKGSDAGTSLKTFMLSLQAPTAKAAETMETLGISVFDTTGKMRDLPGIIGQFEKSLAGLTDEQKVQALDKIFGSDAIRAAQILFSTGTEGFAKLKEAVAANGAAADLANARMKGLTGAWEGFKSQLETIGITIFEVAKAPLTSILQSAAAAAGMLAGWFEKLSPWMQQAVIAIVALVAAAGPLLVIIGGIVSAIGTLVASASGIAIAIGAIIGLMLQIGPVLAILGSELYLLYTAWETNFGGIRDLTAVIANAVQTLWNEAMNSIGELTQIVMAKVTAFWQENGDTIMQIVAQVSDAIRTTWTSVVQFWTENNEAIRAVASAIWEAIKLVVVGATNVILGIVQVFLGVVTGDWRKAWEGTKAILTGVVQVWGGILAGGGAIMVAALQAAFNAVWALNTWVIGKAKEIGINLVQGIISGIGSMGGSLGSAAASIVNGAISRMRSAADIKSPSRVTHEIGQFISQGLADGIEEGGGAAVEAARSSTQNALGEIERLVFNGDFKGFIENAFDILAEKGTSFGDKLKKIFGGIVGNFQKMMTGMVTEWMSSKLFGGGGNSAQGGGGILGGLFGGLAGNRVASGTSIGGSPGTGVPSTNVSNANQTSNAPGGTGSMGGLLGSITGPGGLFGSEGFGNNAGTYGAIGGIGNMIGGMIGGRAGGMISGAATGLGMGASIGSMIMPGIGTAIGAALGAAVGFFASLFGGDPKKKADKKEGLPALNKGFTEAMKQLRDLVRDVRSMHADPDQAIAKANEIRAEIAGGFGIQFQSKWGKKEAAKLIAPRLREADALIEELRGVADVSRAAGLRAQRIIPEFAAGGFPPVGKISLVGEKGPELFVPNVAGRVISNAETQQIMGGSSGGSEPIVLNLRFEHTIDAEGMVHTQLKKSETVGRAIDVRVMDSAANGKIRLEKRGS